jgi:DNA-directed RNA polymerase specialized sigma24 family protein
MLAFVLTANHKESEQCFMSTVDEAFKEQTVFKEWVRSWVKRQLIENAIENVLCVTVRDGQKRDLWSATRHEKEKPCEIDTVTQLPSFERSVFVMSILERYSDWDCSVLLECSMKKVAEARIGALLQLAEFAAFFPRGDGLATRRLGVTA